VTTNDQDGTSEHGPLASKRWGAAHGLIGTLAPRGTPLKPQRIVALLMIMTVGLPGYAALEYRIWKVLQAQQGTFPNQKGHPIQNLTARWIFQRKELLHIFQI
jgi:hypothetical protein